MDKLASERVIVEAPMSFSGSAKRLWRACAGLPRWFGGPLAVLLIVLVWTVVLAWYCVFGLLLVPYRLIRRGSRKRKRDELRHREVLEAMGERPPTR